MPVDKKREELPQKEGVPKGAAPDAPESAPEAPAGRLARLKARLWGRVEAIKGWSSAHRFKAAVLGGAIGLSLITAAVTAVVMVARYDPYAEVTLADTLEALDQGDLTTARTWARALARRGRALALEEMGGPAYVFGVAAYDDAQDTWTKDKRTAYLLASRYLEEARDRGFPDGRRAEGLYLLGKSLYMSDQIAASRPVLREAIRANQNEKKRTELHGLLAEADLTDSMPDLADALENNTQYLKYQFLTGLERDKGMLQRAQILLRMNEDAECRATLDKIPTDSAIHPQVVVVGARLMIRDAQRLRDKPDATTEDRSKARSLLETAIKDLRMAQGSDTLANEATRRSTYLIGVCYLDLGNVRAAVEQFNRTRTLFPNTAEAIAADLQEAELNRLHGRNDMALVCYRRVLQTITDPTSFSNPYFTLTEVRDRIMAAYDDYMRTHNFESALQLARVLHPLFPRIRSMQVIAETYREWGDALVAQSVHLPPSQATAMAKDGRRHLREAGQAFARLARARVASPLYPDDLWNTAESYLNGHAFQNAAQTFQLYLNNESRRRSPRALVGLGEALLSLDQVDKAIESFNQCIEFHPTDAVAYRARLLASRALREEGKTAEAEKLLKENLNGEGITPKSEVWQDSLFDLGELLHSTGRFEEAIRRLEEAVQRQPDAPRSEMARYLIADSYRRRAQKAKIELQKEVVENARIAHTKEIHEMLTAARRQYDEVKVRLLERRDKAELSELERRVLRNCFYSLGDVLFELGDYREAIKTYSIITNRYQAEPEVLQAYLQMIRAYDRLGERPQARRTLQHARVVLAQMADGAKFTETTNNDRQQWEATFAALASQ